MLSCSSYDTDLERIKENYKMSNDNFSKAIANLSNRRTFKQYNELGYYYRGITDSLILEYNKKNVK